MTKPVLRVDPSKISTTLKEAVVDSLVNQTFARISGHGEDGRVLYGARPRALLNSAFLLPTLQLMQSGDEVTQPILISSHGLDLKVRIGVGKAIDIQPSLQVYVRVLPTEDDLMRPDCAVTFRLNDDTKRALNDQVKTELDKKWAEVGSASYRKRKDHPTWTAIEAEVRKKVHEGMGLPAGLDLRTIFSEEVELLDGDGAPVGSQDVSDAVGADLGIVADGGKTVALKDAHAKPMNVPHKWLRIPIDQSTLPILRIEPDASAADLESARALASSALTGAVGAAIRAWADTDEGKRLGFRKGVKVYPSHYKGWTEFLTSLVAGDKPLALPTHDLHWDIKVVPDWSAPGYASVHVALENRSAAEDDETDACIFQVHLDVAVPAVTQVGFKLGRVKASYRYNKYLDYPATGFNGGVELVASTPEALHLRTTWKPRYSQPRIVPVDYGSINRNIRDLSRPDGLAGLLALEGALEDWFTGLDGAVDLAEGLAGTDVVGLNRERAGFEVDKLAWRKEIDSVKAGLDILKESKAAWDATKARGHQPDERARVYEAWLLMNEAMADVLSARLKNDSGAWRLFQIAFVIANIPALATRAQPFRHHYDKTRDDTVTLLYFATGGGKSEAFFGLLAFGLFFDRLRGKATGVTAMLRYPLRLLTIQQAQRCSKVLAKAELVRRKYAVAGDPFSIGFWVGSGGSPNNPKAAGMDFIPDIDKVDAHLATEKRLEQQSVNYELQKAAWNKIPTCPFCNEGTALRLFARLGGTLAHVCTDLKCPSNGDGWTPLPFYICDTDIYDLAPSVLLGTVDKLALIGQSHKTLRRIYGMFGAAPWRHQSTRRLVIPQEPQQFEGGPAAHGCEGLYPAYDDGLRLFHDPFPSLLVQDEAHLLDESLGTFAGLFESSLDAILGEMAKPLNKVVAYEPDGATRRRAKVIAASATVSEPQRQMEHLYQRQVPAMQFPYPGQSLYKSFYAEPAAPPPEDGNRSGLEQDDVERWARMSRLYVAFMTNGRPHTATTVAVLSSFHTVISQAMLDLTQGDDAAAARIATSMADALSPGALQAVHRQRLLEASRAELATLVDLHRISLTYVTNKKGGDQIMAAEFEETRKRHAERSLPISDLVTRLITGSVSQGDIQQTVHDAQHRPAPGKPFEDLSSALRSVIATSAISHGVDVEELNSMFFAGMPSDVAEYIQASSRVGRTHVGFVVLVPTPQRRRDRFIVEVFDSYHRFLERMVQPAAIDRWADKAILRVLPSLIQAYLTGVRYISDITTAAPEDKSKVADLAWIPRINRIFRDPKKEKYFVDGICAFIERAIGLDNEDFAPGGKQHYQEVIRERIYALLKRWSTDDLMAEMTVYNYFRERPSSLERPMTSLRDVDEAGDIHFGNKDLNGRRLESAVAHRVMAFVRHGVAENSDSGEL